MLGSLFGQEIEREYRVVMRAYAVNSTKPLDEPYRIPVQVIVNDLGAILKIQAFGQNISRDQ
jgi:hypothetical protein